jgi:plasmid maintenance system antidote protein VapI
MSPGVYILEELTERSLPVSNLQAALECSSEIMLEYLDGKRSVLPIARNLARFFGTSVSLWKGLDKQWEKRSRKRAENGQPTRESE